MKTNFLHKNMMLAYLPYICFKYDVSTEIKHQRESWNVKHIFVADTYKFDLVL